MVLEDERREARTALEAARDMRHRVNSGAVEQWGAFHNEWGRILAPTRQVRSDELDARVSALGTVIFHAHLARDDDVTYAVLRGVLDVEEWLEAWLRREAPPLAHLPRSDDMMKLMRVRHRISFEPLNNLLQRRAAGDLRRPPPPRRRVGPGRTATSRIATRPSSTVGTRARGRRAISERVQALSWRPVLAFR